MYIIKLNAIDSTNAYLKAISGKSTPKDFTVVVAEEQTDGRGQMGSNWQSEASKNLTFSVFKDVSYLPVNKQFFISITIALALNSALNELRIPKLNIKWPNDILSENKKVAGVLIENVIKNNALVGSIVGIGLNVNQKFFDHLPQASSLHLLTGVIYSKDELLQRILRQIEIYFSRLEALDFENLKKDYENSLFRKNKPSTFQSPDNNTFSGFIKGITDDGKLQVLLEDKILKTFDLKELKLLY